MNQDLGLNVLSQIMNWDDQRARQEFQWLKLMARLKYDGYRDFHAGMRFVESLVMWLQQFQREERETAYSFVRKTLVYVSASEMQKLVEQLYPRHVRARVVRTVAAESGIPPYRVLSDSGARVATDRLRRQTLFMGLSDSARIDAVRHANAGVLSNEQLVQGTQIDRDKWHDLLGNLREDLADSKAQFRLVYLVDDFMGTGTSFLRYDQAKTSWKGKLIRFRDSVNYSFKDLTKESPFASGWELCIHHYIASTAASEGIEERLTKAKPALNTAGWARETYASFGTVLPNTLPLDGQNKHENAAFLALTQKYYDPSIRTKATDVGGVEHLGLGYGGCALPVVLEHNTPNNSISLLWAETEGDSSKEAPTPAMRPLFRRRQRHA